MLGAMILGAACSAPPAADRPNVVVVLLDTLRADHLGCYGYARPTSPNIDRLAAQGLRFTNAVSTSSWTQPAVVSLLTGLLPGSHGLDSDEALKAGEPPRVLAPGVTTLAEAFAAAGYATAAITTNVFLNSVFQVDQGFQFYGSGPLPAAEVTARGLELLGALRSDGPGTPAFLYLHYNDIHGPYRPPTEWANRFRSSERRPLSEAEWERLDYLRLSWGGPVESSPRDLSAYIDRYDACIASTDQAIGRLRAGLDSLGMGENTILLVVSDHGEEFLDHGGFDHGYTLYDEVIRVPMIVRWPAGFREARVVEESVSLVDLAPTLLDLCGVAAPAGLDGESRAQTWRQGAGEDRRVYSELAIRGPYRLAERTPAAKWIFSDSLGTIVEWYDLVADPGERTNLVGRKAPTDLAVTRRIVEVRGHMLEVREAFDEVHAESPVDPELEERLRGLGYLN